MKKDLQLKLAASKEKPGSGEEAESDAGSESSLDEEGKILEEMDDVRSKAASRLKKERKKRRESKNKARIRAAQLALSESCRCAHCLHCPVFPSHVTICMFLCSSRFIPVSKEAHGVLQAVRLTHSKCFRMPGPSCVAPCSYCSCTMPCCIHVIGNNRVRLYCVICPQSACGWSAVGWGSQALP